MLSLQSHILTRSIIGAILTISFTGCVNLQAPKPAISTEIPQQFYGSAQGKSVAQQGYQDFFMDQRLVQVIDLALQHNQDLRAAILNIQKVQQQYQIARNEQFPTIGASSSVIRQVDSNVNPNNPFSSYQISVGMSAYELDLWGRVKSMKDVALQQYLSTQSQRDAVQISLISQVSQAWLNYAFAHAQLQLAEQTIQSQLESYQLNQKRFRAGIESEIPLRQSEMLVESSRHDVANFRTQVIQAKNLLSLLVGQPVPDALLATQPVQQLIRNQVLSSGLPSELMINRPDIKATEYQLGAAGANIGVAKARLFPTISLTANTGFASTALKDLFKSGAFNWAIGPSIDLPIFDRGTRKANIEISKIDQQVALAEYEKSIQNAFKEVNDALATQAFIQDRINAQQRLISATSKTAELSNKRFRAGIDSYLGVLDAQRTAYSAKQNFLLLEQARLNNQIELYKSLGGGLHP